MLISALIAAPLFADTITMKSGETYTGEIVGETSEYIKLKTDTEVLRIPLSDIAKIATPEGEIDVRVQQALTPEAVATSHAAAGAEVSKGLSSSAGLFRSCAGAGMGFVAEPHSPGYYLMGKSPEYVEVFLNDWMQENKEVLEYAAAFICIGCCVIAFRWSIDQAGKALKDALED